MKGEKTMKLMNGMVFQSLITDEEVYNEIVNIGDGMVTVSQFGPTFEDRIVKFKKAEILYSIRRRKIALVNDWQSRH